MPSTKDNVQYDASDRSGFRAEESMGLFLTPAAYEAENDGIPPLPQMLKLVKFGSKEERGVIIDDDGRTVLKKAWSA